MHVAQLMPVPLTVSCFSKIQIDFTFLVPAGLGSPGKWSLNGCVCVRVTYLLTCVGFGVAGFPYNKLMSRTLYMQVLDYDRFTRDDPIGEVCLPLCDISLAKEQTFWRTLQPCKGHTVSIVTNL